MKVRKRPVVFAICFLAALGSIEFASAQVVSENWLKQVGITCGGGLSENTREEIERDVSNSLGSLREVGDRSYKAEDIEGLLGAFKDDARGEAYSSYVTCITSILKVALDSSAQSQGESVEDVFLDAPPLVDEIAIYSGEMKIRAVPGDSFAVQDEDLLFFVRSIDGDSGSAYIDYKVSDASTGSKQSDRAWEGDIVLLRRNCSVIPYSIEGDGTSVSLRLKC